MVSDSVTLGQADADDAIHILEQGVQEREQRRLAALLDKVNWDDLHVLRRVSEVPSLRRAAKELGMSVNTIRARLARLEETLQTVLFARGREGLRITAEGKLVLAIVHEMRAASTRLKHGQGNNVLVKSGEIRICASEGIGAFWLMPRINDLRALVPDLTVVLDGLADQTRIHARSHDVSVGFSRPDDQEMIVSKLATVHFMPFASEQYLREHGVPTSLDDLEGHKCVVQEAAGMNYDSMRLFFTEELMRKLVAVRVNSSFSLYWAVASGVGIGALPTYARAISRRVVPVDLPIRMRFELWLSYSREARASAPVRHAVSWLRSCFDAERYPWFADNFEHPERFGSAEQDGQVIPLFDHMVDLPS